MAYTTSQMALIEFARRGYKAKQGSVISKSGNVLTPRTSKRGYQYIQFRFKVNGKFKSAQIFIHRLVAYLKFGRDKLFGNGMVVRHLDDVKSNNFWRNIDYGTHKQNMEDAKRNGRI